MSVRAPPLGPPLVRSWGPSWAASGASWAVLGPPGAVLELSWRLRGPSRSHPGPSWPLEALFGVSWGSLGGLSGRLGASKARNA